MIRSGGNESICPCPQGRGNSSLQLTVAERFTTAYRSQLEHLSRVAVSEQKVIQADVDALRAAAYLAQRVAAENRRRADAARDALARGHLEGIASVERLSRTRSEVNGEQGILVATEERLQREERAVEEFSHRTSQMRHELQATIAATQTERHQEEKTISEMRAELRDAQRRQEAESSSEMLQRQRAQRAEVREEQHISEMRAQEEIATKHLKESVVVLEKDFARERQIYAERESKVVAQIKQIQRHLGQQLESVHGLSPPPPFQFF